MTRKSLIVAVLSLSFAASSAHARPLPVAPDSLFSPATFEQIYNNGTVWNKQAAECGDSRILRKIERRFRHQVRHVPELPDVEIMEFQRIHQHRYLPTAEDRPIARRYCGATVVLSDGSRPYMNYLIEDEMGFASIGDNVEFCVAGFDRWFVYNGRCRLID